MAEQTGSTSGIRVVHLSTSPNGGAGIAAGRIHLAQEAVGLNTRMLYRGQSTKGPGILGRGEEFVPLDSRFMVRSRLSTHLNRFVTRQPSVLFTPFSCSLPNEYLAKLLGEAQVVNLHNVYNFVNVGQIRKSIPGVPIVITMHDERTLTSGCHYTLSCEGFVTGCVSCPQSRLPSQVGIRKYQFRDDVINDPWVSLVAPSRWLLMQALKAGASAERVHHIPNPIDPANFSMKEKNETEVRRNFVVGWLPGKLDNQFWAGISLVRSQLESIRPGLRLEVHTTTKAVLSDKSTSHGIDLIRVPPLQTEKDRSLFWSGVDVGVSLTSADNFPNVVLEALCVGTPFITNNVGGAGEAISDTRGGVVVNSAEAACWSSALLEMVKQWEAWESRGRQSAGAVRDLYSPEVIGLRYLNHYLGVIDAS